MTLLSDKRILEERNKQNIVIDPYDPSHMGTNSYDVRLGNNFYFPNQDYADRSLDVKSYNNVRDYWSLITIPKLGNPITIPPKTLVLGHTLEIIGGKNTITTSLRCRSSLARVGVSVAKCAGLGDVGYVNRWTMELTNDLNVPVTLYTGMRIGQMLFFEVGETMKQYSGKYMDGVWKPENMLPKLYKDFEKK